MSILQNVGDAGKGDQKGRKGGFKQTPNCFKIVKMIMERNFAPVICFNFSKKDCEAYALQMSKLDFNTSKCVLFYLTFVSGPDTKLISGQCGDITVAKIKRPEILD